MKKFFLDDGVIVYPVYEAEKKKIIRKRSLITGFLLVLFSFLFFMFEGTDWKSWLLFSLLFFAALFELGIFLWFSPIENEDNLDVRQKEVLHKFEQISEATKQHLNIVRKKGLTKGQVIEFDAILRKLKKEGRIDD